METNSRKRKAEAEVDPGEEEVENGEEDEGQRKACYCGKLAPTQQNMKHVQGKVLISLEDSSRSLKCKSCGVWIHLDCVKCEFIDAPLHGDYCYIFTCADCNEPSTTDSFSFSIKKWTDVVIIALYNLWLKKCIAEHHSEPIVGRKDERNYFKIHDITDFINRNWAALCTGRERTKTWTATINSTLSTRTNKDGGFLKGSEQLNLELGMWGYSKYNDMPQPYSEVIIKQNSGSRAKKKLAKERGELLEDSFIFSDPSQRRALRTRQNRGSLLEDLDELEDPDWYWIPRNYEPSCYQLQYSGKQVMCHENSAKYCKIDDNGCIVTNDQGGYRVSRSAHGLHEGSCYFEVTILPNKDNKETVVRVGWSLRFGDVESPLGFDEFSYSYHSKSGKIFHKSLGKEYGESFGEGDVIGCLITLPPLQKEIPTLTMLFPKHQSELSEALFPNPGSKIEFFKNGVPQGSAFVDIHHGVYYPAVSIFTGSVSVAFGPPATKYAPENALAPFRFASELPNEKCEIAYRNLSKPSEEIPELMPPMRVKSEPIIPDGATMGGGALKEEYPDGIHEGDTPGGLMIKEEFPDALREGGVIKEEEEFPGVASDVKEEFQQMAMRDEYNPQEQEEDVGMGEFSRTDDSQLNDNIFDFLDSKGIELEWN